MRCVLLAKKWPRFGSNFKKMAKKISNGESDGERKIYPSANPAWPLDVNVFHWEMKNIKKDTFI